MYLFWFIPIFLAVIAILWGIYAMIKRRPLAPDNSRVLTDKPTPP